MGIELDYSKVELRPHCLPDESLCFIKMVTAFNGVSSSHDFDSAIATRSVAADSKLSSF